MYPHCPPHAGIRTIDATAPVDSALRVFTCKGILLNWTGDYPAQCKIAGHHELMCHWCDEHGEHRPELKRKTYGGFRRYLAADAGERTDPAYGPPEVRPPPPGRTHKSYVDDAERQRDYVGAKCRAPYKTTGCSARGKHVQSRPITSQPRPITSTGTSTHVQ